MPEHRVLIRADANSRIGLGHLIRTAALAQMLHPDFEVDFIVQDTPAKLRSTFIPKCASVIELPASATGAKSEIAFYKENKLLSEAILVLDGYQFDASFQEELKKENVKLVYIDDLHQSGYAADLVINQADFISEADYHAHSVNQFCLGPRYALLRQPFLEAAKEPQRQIRDIDSVFISFGGADTHNITYKAVKLLNEIKHVKHIHILSSSANKSIDVWKHEFSDSRKLKFHQDLDCMAVCELMKQCQLALCPSSSLSLELCSVGVVLLTGTTADNQKGYYRSLTHHNAAIGAGDWLQTTEPEISDHLNAIFRMTGHDMQQLVFNQRRYIDGRSGERLLNAFKELAVC